MYMYTCVLMYIISIYHSSSLDAKCDYDLIRSDTVPIVSCRQLVGIPHSMVNFGHQPTRYPDVID